MSLGFWWCVQPQAPVVWGMQWWAVLEDGSVAADAAGALKKTPARVEDDYRFHDAFHLAHAAVLGWSPVSRFLLGCK
ncbi:hypothetical protein ACWGJ5_46485, partial [Streptomyces sp. NPDC054783]